MTKKAIIATILIAILISASAYVVYSQFYNSQSSSTTSSHSNSPTTGSQSSSSGNDSTDPSTSPNSSSSSAKNSDSTNVSIVDGAGYRVELPSSIKRIVVLDGTLAEMLCYMGLQDSIVGRTDAQCPPQLLNVPSVGEAAYAMSLEKVFELQPDIIIADSVLTYDDYTGGAYPKLVDAGITVYISQPPASAQNPLQMTPEELYNAPTGIDIVCSVMQDLSTVVGNKERVDTFVTWAQGYNKLVKDRIATLPREQQTLAFIDWYFYTYQTFVDLKLYQAGGINIAENSTIASPILSLEFIVEKNPSVIIELISSPTHDVNDFISARNDILSRPALQDIDAVKNGRVYVCDFSALNGMHSIVGYLYYAKWVQPDLFADIDPAAVATQLQQQYLGTSVAEVYCYPR